MTQEVINSQAAFAVKGLALVAVFFALGALTKWNKWYWLFFGTAVAVWLWSTFVPSN